MLETAIQIHSYFYFYNFNVFVLEWMISLNFTEFFSYLAVHVFLYLSNMFVNFSGTFHFFFCGGKYLLYKKIQLIQDMFESLNVKNDVESFSQLFHNF